MRTLPLHPPVDTYSAPTPREKSRRRPPPTRMALLFLFVLSILATSCAPRRTPLTGASISEAERTRISELLLLRDEEISSLRSLSQVDLTEPDSSTSIRGVLVFEKPDKFRLELLPLSTTYTLKLLVAREGLATLIDPIERAAVRSSSASGLLQAALKLPLSEPDLMSYFLARVPPRFAARVSDSKEATATSDSASGILRIQIKATGDVWNIDPNTGLLTAASLMNRFDGSTDVELRYSGALQNGAITLPAQIEVRLPRQSLSMTFTLTTSKLNQEIQESLFSIEIPEGYSILRK